MNFTIVDFRLSHPHAFALEHVHLHQHADLAEKSQKSNHPDPTGAGPVFARRSFNSFTSMLFERLASELMGLSRHPRTGTTRSEHGMFRFGL